LFESMNYAMSALSTTGMNLSRAGLTAVHNPAIGWILAFLMILGATSFSLHYAVLKKGRYGALTRDSEFKSLLLLSLFGAVLIAPKFLHFYGSNFEGFGFALFHAISSLTSGGFSIASEAAVFAWDDFVKIVLFALMFIGGSAGSTAGGIKLSRFLIMGKSVLWKIQSSVLPQRSFFQKSFEGRSVESKAVKNVYQFILLYALFVLLGTMVVTSYGYDLGNSLLEVTSAQSNVGIGNGIAKQGMPLGIQVMLIVNMWVGRLEIIPVLATAGFILSIKAKR